MAKVTDQLQGPSFQPLNTYNQRVQDWIEDLAIEYGDGIQTLQGEVIKFPVADGYARYIVTFIDDATGEIELAHLAMDDTYQVPDYQLLGIDYGVLEQLVARERALRAMFS